MKTIFDELISAVDAGAFSKTPYDAYLRKVRASAKHIVMPVSLERLYEELDDRKITEFYAPSRARGKLFAFDGIHGIEDDASVVIVENDILPLTARISELKIEEGSHVFLTARLTLAKEDTYGKSYRIETPFVSKLANQQSTTLRIDDLSWLLAGQDLVNSMNTVLDQAAYLQLRGYFSPLN